MSETSFVRSKPFIGAAILIVVAVLVAGAWALFAPRASPPEPTPVVLKVGNQKGTIKALMTATGVLEGAPYTVEWSEFPAAQHLLEALNAGAADVGLVGDAPFLFAYAAGSNLKVVSALRYGSGSSVALIVPENSPIRTLSDLKGKRIATGKVSIGHYLLLRALEEGHLTTKDIEPVFVAPSDAKAAFSSGKVDAWSTWSPFLTTAVHQDKARVLISGEGILNSYAYNVATQTAVHDKSAQLRDFLARLEKAYAWGQAHKEDYAKALSRDTGLPYEIALAMVREQSPVIAPLNSKVVRSADDILRHLARAEGQPAPKRAIDDAFATEFKVAD